MPVPVVGELNPISQFCFAMVVRVLAKLISGDMNESRVLKEKGQVLTRSGSSSVVVDHLSSRARGENTTITCFYFDFASQNEQSPTRFLGSLLKQMVFGLEEMPEEISKAYEDRKNAVGGQGLQISDILNMLQTTTARKRAFICIDGLDECAAEHIAKVADSLGQLLHRSPGTRIFATGRPHIIPEIRARLGERVTSISINPKRDDIIMYLNSRLATDTTSDAMDSTLKADILEKIPNDISEMYVEATPHNPS